MIGTDLIEIERIKNSIDKWGDKFIDRIFTEKEKKYCQKRKSPFQCFAIRYAAKESFYKAYNHSFGWKAIEILFNEKPYINIREEKLRKKLSDYDVHLTLSHTEKIGSAFVLLQKK